MSELRSSLKMSIDCSLKSLNSPNSNELLQSHNNLTFKLLKTVADFSQALATLHENFGHELQVLVENFRKRNGELRKERLHCPNGIFQVWELFLQQVEVNSQQHGDISRNFNQTIGRGLVERLFHRKIQSKKIFAHRDRIETILLKSSELLLKCHRDYCQAYALALTNPAQHMSEYIGSHNVYVHQLQATNGMIHAYQTKTLPKLLEELEECHMDTSSSISSSLLESSELVSEKSTEQACGYQMIANACKQTNHKSDLAQFVKLAQQQLSSGNNQISSGANELSSPKKTNALDEAHYQQQQELKSSMVRYHQFQSPNLQSLDHSQFDSKNLQIVPTFKNEIAPDLSQPPAQQQPQLESDRKDLEEKIEKLEERVESLNKLLLRSIESRLHNKVDEFQEELCQKRFELQVAQIHLSAVRSQLQLFEYNYRPAQYNLNQGTDSNCELMLNSVGQMSNSSSLSKGNLAASGLIGGAGGSIQALPGYRNKWIKAFRTLKETPGSSSPSSASSSSQQKFNEETQKLELAQVAQQQQQQQTNHQQQQQQQENQHFFQEYTFKKIASCDVCKDFLRGHMRQGVKCKLCKISSHNECQSKAHVLIKCQQPKIKLLRRQKSAGELEVNNSDADSAEQSERPLASKPDSIYQLIRQVLDAKKKGQQQQQQPTQLHHESDYHLKVAYGGSNAYGMGALASSGLMNLSTGNLALANADGKSVSTSALMGNSGSASSSAATVSVDRWAVVMDLLAESRKKDRETLPLESVEPQSGVSSGGKRHSKQLDKFKLAAKSAAAVSKHKHYYLQQQQRQQQQQQPQASSPNSLSPQEQDENCSSSPLRNSVGYSPPMQQQQQQLVCTNSSPLAGAAQFTAQTSNTSGTNSNSLASASAPSANSAAQGSQLHRLLQPTSNADAAYMSQQQLHLHHTKSLPVGQAQQQQQQQQQQALNSLQANEMLSLQTAGLSSMPYQHHQQQQHHIQQQQQQHLHQQNQLQQQQQQQQLLNICDSQQQLQSTSAPHSPQRKRFNLRMKSFSLDSPESPSVVGGGVASSGNAYAPVGSAQHHQQHASGGNLSSIDRDQQPQPSGQLLSAYQQHNQDQQQHQHGYLSQQQLYLHSSDYQQQPQNYLQQNYPQYLAADLANDSQLSAYLSANQVRGAGGGGQVYQHRHSYHNPSSFHYASAQSDSLQAQQQQQAQHSHHHHHHQQQQAHNSTQSSSQSALNSLATHHLDFAGLLAKSKQSAAQANGSMKTETDKEQQQQQHASSDSLAKESAGPTSSKRSGSNNNNEYYDLGLEVGLRPNQQQQQSGLSGAGSSGPTAGTYVVLYDYLAQRADEIQLSAGQLVSLIDSNERDWWKVRALDGSQRAGYFPSTYLTRLYQNERPLQVIQTIQVSNGETYDKLLRGQIVIHTGKQLDSFVTIRTVVNGGDLTSASAAPLNAGHYIQCPEKYLMEVVEES